MNQPSIITTKLNIVTVGSNVTVAHEEKTTKVLHIVGLVLTYAFLVLTAFIAILPSVSYTHLTLPTKRIV